MAYYNECQLRPSAGMGKLCSEAAAISEPFAPLPLSDFRWIAKGHYANYKNQKYIKHAHANIQLPIIIKQGGSWNTSLQQCQACKNPTAMKKIYIFSAAHEQYLGDWGSVQAVYLDWLDLERGGEHGNNNGTIGPFNTLNVIQCVLENAFLTCQIKHTHTHTYKLCACFRQMNAANYYV